MENVKKRKKEIQLRAETMFRLCMFYESLKLQTNLEVQINIIPHYGLHFGDYYLFIGVGMCSIATKLGIKTCVEKECTML